MNDDLLVESKLFARYRSLPGVPDELVDAYGTLRPAWRGLIDHLSGLTPDQIDAAMARGDQSLADSGVFFRNHGHQTAAMRAHPFSAVPIILPQSDWTEIEQGLIQRADLLERIAADIYGENRLVAEGHLPASLIAQSPEFLRPLVGVKPRSGHFLNFIAFEIGRGPDGRWWVLADRTDAPSGAGFALENRVAGSRVFPEVYQRSNVHRLGGFFRAFRDALEGLRQDPSAQVSVLTPGPMSDTYSEQAYIARIMGLPLLEGEDLLLDGGRIMLRTVDGLVPVDVLWRRMDGMWADPLELREDSQLGTAGLVSAIRRGQVSMLNALGVGVLETQALMAFLPKLSEVLTGQPLGMPNVATWWCGQDSELAHVRANIDRMMIGPALATRMPFESDADYAIGGELRRGDGVQATANGAVPDVDTWLGENAEHLVAKELVRLSTTPVYDNGALEPRPMSLRVFLARTPQGWQVMPGGFARIGANEDTSAVSMRNGGSVADVWISSETPVDTRSFMEAGMGAGTAMRQSMNAPLSSLPPLSQSSSQSMSTVPPQAMAARGAASPMDFVHVPPHPLPSQAADNFFWLGRYVERTEGLIRLVRAYHSRLEDTAQDPLLAMIRARLMSYGVKTDDPFPSGLLATLGSAVYTASQVRDRLNVDAWAALMDIDKSMHRIAKTTRAGSDAASVMSVMLRKLSGFAGLVHENMYRTSGWQFLTLGRSMERAAMLADLLAAVADPKAPDGGFDLAIEVGDSLIVHRQRYAVFARRETVLDLLARDRTNPRALQFNLDVIARRAEEMCGTVGDRQARAFAAEAKALQDDFAARPLSSLNSAALRHLFSQILDLSATLGAAFVH